MSKVEVRIPDLGDFPAVDVIEVPGTHNSMLEQPHVAALGDAISHCIERLDTE